MPEQQADVGLIGLAVMGENLALNMADHGFSVAVYNRTTSVTERVLADHPPGSFGDLGGGLTPHTSPESFVRGIARPRRVVVMVKAGKATDAVIEQIAELLEPGDLLVDGGNAHWEDTIRRERALRERGLLFIGSGVSGGEEGARFGPSLMPGGAPEAWELLRPVWDAIAAKVDPETGTPIGDPSPGKPVTGGEPCAGLVGPDGAGHFVKMVHNGIEYGDMQMIAEAYHLLRTAGGMSAAATSEVFAAWNEGDLDSFLIEITADILRQKDPRTGNDFVDVVLDAAGQKGTGRWTAIAALDFGVPASTIAEAVLARTMSALKEERVAASEILRGPTAEDAHKMMGDIFESRGAFVDAVGRALYCAKICSYAQGFQLLSAASEEYGWALDFGAIAKLWRGGCIIRAKFLQKITDAYARDPRLKNLVLDPYFREAIDHAQDDWRRVLALSSAAGVPSPAFASSLAYFDAYRSRWLPANLLQAQRDYFGAHTYERQDEPRGVFFHLDWPDPERPERRVE